MEVRLAVIEDLPVIKETYVRIVENMEKSGIYVWDEVYPTEYFEDDIKSKRLYVLFEGDKFVSAFALCEFLEGEDFLEWHYGNVNALWLCRFGVAPEYTGKGIAGYVINEAKKISLKKGVEYLRLFVVESNIPAIKLYEKNGFIKAKGAYFEPVQEGPVLAEYGYEIKISGT